MRVDDEDGEELDRNVTSHVLLLSLIATAGNKKLNASKLLEKRIFKNSNIEQLCASWT